LRRLSQWFQRKVRPGTAFILGLLSVVMLGTAALRWLPTTPPDRPIGLVDALFTATSAVCVTGLIVRDTATAFTPLGQWIILVLIQVGGLGVMLFSGTVSLLLGHGVSLRDSSVMRELFQGEVLKETRQIIRFILGMTAVVETIGTVVLFFGLRPVVPGFRACLATALFHSVSAFCNAGFSLFSGSLTGVVDRPAVTLPVAALLITGGLGFPVVANLLAWGRGRALRHRRLREEHRRLEAGAATTRRLVTRLSVATRTVLSMTLLLLVLGTVLLLALEWNGAFAGASPWHKLSWAFFQAATTRTAGFNTMDLTLLSPAAVLLLILLMGIGAGPASTAGGIKVTTLAVLWANARSIAQGRMAVKLFDREVTLLTVRRAFMVFFAWFATAMLGTFVLLVSEGQAYLPTVFEVVSAMGTVGLSLGLTPELSVFGRLVIVVLMFVGRVGPLGVAYGLVTPAREHNVRYPRAQVIVG